MPMGLCTKNLGPQPLPTRGEIQGKVHPPSHLPVGETQGKAPSHLEPRSACVGDGLQGAEHQRTHQNGRLLWSIMWKILAQGKRYEAWLLLILAQLFSAILLISIKMSCDFTIYMLSGAVSNIKFIPILPTFTFYLFPFCLLPFHVLSI